MTKRKVTRVEVCRCGHDDNQHKSGGFLHRTCEVSGCICVNFTFSRSERRES